MVQAGPCYSLCDHKKVTFSLHTSFPSSLSWVLCIQTTIFWGQALSHPLTHGCFIKKSPWPPWLHGYDMRISCTKAKSIKYSSHLQIHCYDVTQNYWALRLSLLYVMSWCNSFTAPSILRDPLYFSLLVTQKPLWLLQPQTVLNVSVSRKIFNDSWISPFHIT